ncbi:MAG: SDR family NAD(P)-dependent oxidoreductase [Bacteriovoracaceae bacterium]|jgi:NAD(P)-dependent dehydrogenase (short-subunit alcohol dehydrogenase family)|nr:SDR family NAD(P)-dependent oxidoreductase [Bacteriovoracaceae bacterium]
MSKNIFISGISSGIGKAMAISFAQNNYQVYGISRSKLDYSHNNILHQCVDITNYTDSQFDFIEAIDFDLCFLNSGILGKIAFISKTSLKELQDIMNTNLWAQKNLIDTLKNKAHFKYIIGISSGAALKGGLGWSGYSLSKAAFKTLLELYSAEDKNTTYINLAPGLVNTKMQDYLCDVVNKEEFPNIQRLAQARENGTMLSPNDFAIKLNQNLSSILKTPSGGFIDIRSFE